MSKQLISNYSYNTTAKTVTLTDFTTVKLERLQLITNTTTNQIIYNFADSTVATATVSGNVITLSAAPGTSTDKLMVIYDAASGDPTYDGYRELAGLSAGALNADLVPSTDVSGYKSFAIQITGTWVGTLTLQFSNDNSTWVSGAWYNSSDTTGTPPSANATGNSIKVGSILGRYIRVRLTSYTSGTTTGVAELYTVATQTNVMGLVGSVQSGTWTVGSNSASGSAVPTNVFPIGVSDPIGNLTTLRVSSNYGDATTLTQGLPTNMFLWNGTNYDRYRAATSAAGTTGTGVPAAGMLGFDGTNYQRIKTNTGGQTSVILNDTFGNGISQVTPGDALSAAPTTILGVASHNLVYNGTNHVRQRGDVNGTYSTPTATTTGGAIPYKLISAATTNATSVKASAGNVYSITAMNTNAAARYLKLYDKASSATVGTDVPVQTILLPGNTTGAGVAIALSVPISFSNGISFAITGAMPDTDTTAIAANDCVINLAYK